MGLFPPRKGGGEGVKYGYKGKGILIHTLTDGNGLPLANRTTPANGSETDQVIPLLDSVKVKTNRPGRPRKRVKVLAADQGYDFQCKPAALRKHGMRPQLPKRVWKTKKNRGRPIKISVPRFRTASVVSLGMYLDKNNYTAKVCFADTLERVGGKKLLFALKLLKLLLYKPFTFVDGFYKSSLSLSKG